MTQKPKRTDPTRKRKFDRYPLIVIKSAIVGLKISSYLPDWIVKPLFSLAKPLFKGELND